MRRTGLPIPISNPPAPGPRCPSCGYDIRLLGRSPNCPECGQPIPPEAFRTPEAVDLAATNGFEPISVGLYGSTLVMSGLIVMGWFGPPLAVFAALALGQRILGIRRLRRGPIASTVPPLVGWVLVISSLGEALVAGAVLGILALFSGPTADTAWLVASLVWCVVAGVGISGIALAVGHFGREVGSRWPSIAAIIVVVSAGLAVAGGLACGLLGYATIPSLPDLSTWRWPMALVAAVPAAIAVKTTGLLLGSIESHAIHRTVDAHAVALTGVDPGRILRRPLGNRTASESEPEHDPIPLAPEKPPVRESER